MLPIGCVLLLAFPVPAQPPEPLPTHALNRIGSSRLRPKGAVHHVYFSRDGTRLATDTYLTFTLWDTTTGARVANHPARGISRLVCNNSLLLVRNSANGATEIFDRASGKRIAEIDYFHVVVNADETRLMIVEDRELKLLSLPDLKPLPSVKLPAVPAWNGVSVSPRGNYFMHWGSDNDDKLWLQVHDLRTQKRTGRWRLAASTLPCFSEDESLILGRTGESESESILLWRREDGKLLREWTVDSVDAVCDLYFTSDLKYAYYIDAPRIEMGDFTTIGPTRKLMRRELATGKEEFVADLTGAVAWGSILAVDRKEETLAVANKERPTRIRLWNLRTGKEILPPGENERDLFQAHLSHDGKHLACHHPKQVDVRDPLTGKLQFTISAKKHSGRGVMFPDRPILAVSEGEAADYPYRPATNLTHRFYDLNTQKLLGAVKEQDPDEDRFCFLAGKKECAIVGRESLRWWCPDQKKITSSTKFGKENASIHEFAAQGNVLCVVYDKKFEFLDLKTKAVIARHPSKGNVFNVAIAPDQRMAALQIGGGKVLLASIDPKSKLRLLAELGREVFTFKFSPDSQKLAAIVGMPFEEAPPVLVVIDLASGSIDTVEALSFAQLPTALRFSPDGRNLLAYGQRSVSIYEWPSQLLRLRLEGHVGEIQNLHYFPDGKRLVTQANDATAVVWDLLRTKELSASPQTADEIWKDLASIDGERGHRAVCRGIHAGADFAKFLDKQLNLVCPVDTAQIGRWIADLSDAQFTKRTAAQKELERLKELALPGLRGAKGLSMEASRRVQRLILALAERRYDPETLRLRRAIEVLEYSPTPQAREILKRLATGNPDALLTHEARLALQRRKSS